MQSHNCHTDKEKNMTLKTTNAANLMLIKKTSLDNIPAAANDALGLTGSGVDVRNAALHFDIKLSQPGVNMHTKCLHFVLDRGSLST